MIRSVSSGNIRLDSVKLSVPRETVTGFKRDAFTTLAKYRGGESVAERHEFDRRLQRRGDVVGLKSVVIGQESAQIEFSAKILQRQYPDLIHAGNIASVVDRINETGFCSIDRDGFLERAEVLRCDCTSDLHVTGEIGEYLQSLRVYGSLHPKYEATPYKRTGLVFRKKVASYKERVLMYDKFTDVMRDKDRDILNPDAFQNVLRVESNHTDFKHIRERFNVGKERLLMDVLSSMENVNLKLFTGIVDCPDIAEVKGRFDALRSIQQPLHQIEKRYGMERIVRDCNYDMELVREFLKGLYSEGSNISHVVRRYRELLADMIAIGDVDKEASASGFDTDHIDEMRELLKVA